jgi:hypothetical protein
LEDYQEILTGIGGIKATGLQAQMNGAILSMGGIVTALQVRTTKRVRDLL